MTIFYSFGLGGSSHHAAHAAHTSHTTWRHAASGCFRGQVDDHSLSGDHEGSDTSGVDEGGADNLHGVDDALLDHVAVFANLSIEASVHVIALKELVNDDGAFEAGVSAHSLGGDLAGLLDDLDADVLVEVSTLELVETSGSVEESSTAADDDTFLSGSSGGAESILDTVLELTDLNLGGTADLDDGNTTGESSHALLKLLFVVLGRSLVHAGHDRLNTLFDLSDLTGTTHQDSVVLGDDDLLGRAENGDVRALKGLTEVLADELGTSGDGNVLHGVSAVVTEAGGLDDSDLKATTDLVKHKGGEGLRLDVLSDQEEGLLLLGAGLEEGKDLLD